MVKAVLLTVAGAVAALEGERQFSRLWARYKPSAVTDSLLDKANRKLEEGNRRADVRVRPEAD